MNHNQVIHIDTGVISGFPVSALTTLLAASSPISVRVRTVALPMCGSTTGIEQIWQLRAYYLIIVIVSSPAADCDRHDDDGSLNMLANSIYHFQLNLSLQFAVACSFIVERSAGLKFM